MITIIHQGSFTTIQDEGRFGYQAYGMPSAGAMDRYACKVANLLVGNHASAAVIEMTGFGASFKFDEEQFVAVCGADMHGNMNGVPIRNWSSFTVARGSEIKFHAAAEGYRTYLALAGGIDVPIVLGSRSTYTRAKVGGYEGRVLWQGDVLTIGKANALPIQPRNLESNCIPPYSEQINLRVILGPQDHLFTPDAIKAFFESTYTITEQANRINYRLKGPRITHVGKADIVSDAVCLGAIQVPASGMPIIMTADHQTTGGFAKLGSVIRVDLSTLAQGRPGDQIRFRCVAEAEAIEALKDEQQRYSNIENLCNL
ncbi:MAG: biotin-dependent carboxyltransferase family protein [Sporomusaceae bacterium]|nr:biotin-dependent carboxyltransferase family protein [Sporomusaceae bacterium]